MKEDEVATGSAFEDGGETLAAPSGADLFEVISEEFEALEEKDNLDDQDEEAILAGLDRAYKNVAKKDAFCCVVVAQLHQKLGELLNQAKALCKKHGISWESFLERLPKGKSTARKAMRLAEHYIAAEYLLLGQERVDRVIRLCGSRSVKMAPNDFLKLALKGRTYADILADPQAAREDLDAAIDAECPAKEAKPTAKSKGTDTSSAATKVANNEGDSGHDDAVPPVEAADGSQGVGTEGTADAEPDCDSTLTAQQEPSSVLTSGCSERPEGESDNNLATQVHENVTTNLAANRACVLMRELQGILDEEDHNQLQGSVPREVATTLIATMQGIWCSVPFSMVPPPMHIPAHY